MTDVPGLAQLWRPPTDLVQGVRRGSQNLPFPDGEGGHADLATIHDAAAEPDILVLGGRFSEYRTVLRLFGLVTVRFGERRIFAPRLLLCGRQFRLQSAGAAGSGTHTHRLLQGLAPGRLDGRHTRQGIERGFSCRRRDPLASRRPLRRRDRDRRHDKYGGDCRSSAASLSKSFLQRRVPSIQRHTRRMARDVFNPTRPALVVRKTYAIISV